MRTNRAEALFLAAVLTAFAVMLLAGHGPWAGDLLLPLTANHGINGGDTLVFGLWLVSMAVLWRIGPSEADRRALVGFVTQVTARNVSSVQRRSSQAFAIAVRYARAILLRLRTPSVRSFNFHPTPGHRTLAIRQLDDGAGGTSLDRQRSACR